MQHLQAHVPMYITVIGMWVYQSWLCALLYLQHVHMALIKLA